MLPQADTSSWNRQSATHFTGSGRIWRHAPPSRGGAKTRTTISALLTPPAPASGPVLSGTKSRGEMRLELLGMGEEEKYGWLGRYFDNACQGCDPSVGVSLSSEMPQAFTASTPTGICIPANNRRLNDKGEQEGPVQDTGGSSIDLLGGKTSSKLSPLDYLKRTNLDGRMSNKKISSILQNIPHPLVFLTIS